MIKTITPTSPILRKYIECFYIYEGNGDTAFSYVAFPHFNTGLSFFKGASIHSQNWSLQISEITNRVTYEEGYYDQSYLIKEFRKITNYNPKDFFKSTSKVDGDKIIWEIK